MEDFYAIGLLVLLGFVSVVALAIVLKRYVSIQINKNGIKVNIRPDDKQGGC